ncbi:hypothetical protein [Acaryochloris sp. IP29b_bin.137]|uniref:hypothetical protein n=1 Tax=Acaryochloris sp. IP29b_bin.137 TaxID=2969217 RepID=UPI00344D9F70
MKRFLSVGLGVLAVAVGLPFVSGTPVFANLQKAGEALVQRVFQPQVKLVLSAEKQVITPNTEGGQERTWQTLEGDVTVRPGDVLRYTLVSENAGDKPAAELRINQPIPKQTTFVLESARANGAKLSYSIDGGQTYSEKPMIEVTQPDGTVEIEPAPAEAYTHVQWDYRESLQPMASVKAVYEVAVQ